MIYKDFKKLLILFGVFLFLTGLGMSYLIWSSLSATSECTYTLKLLWCLIGIVLILVSAFLIIINRQIESLLHSIDYLFQCVLSKKTILNLDKSVDNRLSKVAHQAHKIVHMLTLDTEKLSSDKENLQSLISDISHQVKTPLANLEMYNTLLLEMELTSDEKQEFLTQIHTQIDKLKWLMDSLIKVSRMESGIIQLNAETHSLKQIIALAISSVYEQASHKNIKISLHMEQDLSLYCDKNWTIEAIFNLLDNAVKYSFINTSIDIKVTSLELYTQIDVANHGLTIEPHELTRVFKRFYRSPQVADIEGSGIGLYLTKVILEKQSGYIKVSSHEHLTTFSIFMYNHLN